MFDPTKPYKCRDSRPARIIATDLKGDYPLAVVSELTPNEEYVYRVNLNGSACPRYRENDEDLVNISEEEAVTRKDNE